MKVRFPKWLQYTFVIMAILVWLLIMYGKGKTTQEPRFPATTPATR